MVICVLGSTHNHTHIHARVCTCSCAGTRALRPCAGFQRQSMMACVHTSHIHMYPHAQTHSLFNFHSPGFASLEVSGFASRTYPLSSCHGVITSLLTHSLTQVYTTHNRLRMYSRVQSMVICTHACTHAFILSSPFSHTHTHTRTHTCMHMLMCRYTQPQALRGFAGTEHGDLWRYDHCERYVSHDYSVKFPSPEMGLEFRCVSTVCVCVCARTRVCVPVCVCRGKV